MLVKIIVFILEAYLVQFAKKRFICSNTLLHKHSINAVKMKPGSDVRVDVILLVTLGQHFHSNQRHLTPSSLNAALKLRKYSDDILFFFLIYSSIEDCDIDHCCRLNSITQNDKT